MPNAYIEKLVKDGKGSIEELEKKWDKAKELADEQGHTEEYDYITGIFKKMIGENVEGFSKWLDEDAPTQSHTSGGVALHSSPTSIVRKRPMKMCDCGSHHYKMVTDAKASPVWQCGSCGSVSERQTRSTAGKKKFRDLMNGIISEKKAEFEIYHDTFSSAVQDAMAYAEKQGYEIKDEDWFQTVSNGPKKPSEGNTNRYKLDLYKGDKKQNKSMNFQVHGMKKKWELNVYIS